VQLAIELKAGASTDRLCCAIDVSSTGDRGREEAPHAAVHSLGGSSPPWARCSRTQSRRVDTFAKMNAGAAVVGTAELIKWQDALDDLVLVQLEQGLQKARECLHPDAQWLASLFPPGAEATQERMREVMLEHQDDPRAVWLAWAFDDDDEGLLRRAAVWGYAPAQTDLAMLIDDDDAERVPLLEKAAAQNDRNALFELGCWWEQVENGKEKAIELYRKAAELNHREAQFEYGLSAFGGADWERFHWWSRAAVGYGNLSLCSDVAKLLPSFERGECGRILSIAVPVIRKNLETWKRHEAFLRAIDRGRFTVVQVERVIELQKAMLGRARAAIDCWSVVGRRCRVVKDMRVVIAKMLWEEVWRWGEKEQDAREEKKAKRG
jgi:hypothetical protein